VTNKDDQERHLQPRSEADAARKRRLATALRENLKRRKAQARQRTDQNRVASAKED